MDRFLEVPTIKTVWRRNRKSEWPYDNKDIESVIKNFLTKKSSGPDGSPHFIEI